MVDVLGMCQSSCSQSENRCMLPWFGHVCWRDMLPKTMERWRIVVAQDDSVQPPYMEGSRNGQANNRRRCYALQTPKADRQVMRQRHLLEYPNDAQALWGFIWLVPDWGAVISEYTVERKKGLKMSDRHHVAEPLTAWKGLVTLYATCWWIRSQCIVTRTSLT